MGCDIHIYAEVQIDGKWQKAGKVFKYPYYLPEKPTETDEEGYTRNAPMIDEPYRGRNYDLFAILANVRNGHGFAGCITGTGFNPISLPRGLPNNVSKETRVISEQWGSAGHSHSWLMLQELLDADWTQTTWQCGVVDRAQYKVFLEEGKPREYSGDILGAKVRTVEPEAMLSTPDDGMLYVTRIWWNETYADAVGPRWFETLEALKQLGTPDKVRIVFFFDN